MRQVESLILDDREYHKPAQLYDHFRPHIITSGITPEWFLDLGPGSSSEYLEASMVWPKLKILALEPSEVGFKLAAKRFPKHVVPGLFKVAAWDRNEQVKIYQSDDLNHGELFIDYDHAFSDNLANEKNRPFTTTLGMTLDTLDEQFAVLYGRINKAMLWMDVEGSERRVLKGAKNLLERGAIYAINIEMRPGYVTEIHGILSGYGFALKSKYFECDTYWDEVWINANAGTKGNE
jgi:FkbM family methyltransferase